LAWDFWSIAAPRSSAIGARYFGSWCIPIFRDAAQVRLLLQGLRQMARELGLEQLRLSVRGGTGVERFYERFGYTLIGAHPGALRIGPGDDRDEIMMVARL